MSVSIEKPNSKAGLTGKNRRFQELDELVDLY